jgi:hypothetical protein
MLRFGAFISALALSAALAAPGRALEIAQAGAPAAATRIGVAAAVAGPVRLDAVPGVREVGVDVASGTPIFLGDAVTTGPGGRLQIMLRDETVFTIGPDAAMKIDKFVYDPASGVGTVNASIAKGAFRFVSGQVAKRNPSDMEVRVPTGTIGIRGTSVAGVVDGARATIVLLGPGAETDTGERVGRILVTAANTTVEVSRPGFAVDLAGLNVPPTAPFRVDAATVNRIVAPLSGPPRGSQAQGQPGGPPGAAPAQGQGAQGQAPGQPGPGQGARQAVGEGPAPRDQAGAGVAGGLQGVRTMAGILPQQAAIQGLAAGARPPGGGIFQPGALMTFGQLRQIDTGKAEFHPVTVAMVRTAGGTTQTVSYTFRFNYDFGARQTFGSNVSITVSGAGAMTAGTGTFPLLASPFATRNGPALLSEQNITVPTLGGTANVSYDLLNGQNRVLGAIKSTVQYSQAGNTFQGSGTSQRR